IKIPKQFLTPSSRITIHPTDILGSRQKQRNYALNDTVDSQFKYKSPPKRHRDNRTIQNPALFSSLPNLTEKKEPEARSSIKTSQSFSSTI
ncbi:hypothetical protein CCACVL1_09346, partial [Corchorus capsularis]